MRLPDPLHEIAHGLGGLVLLLVGSVGVGAQREPCVVVAQHIGDGLDIYTVLECHGWRMYALMV